MKIKVSATFEGKCDVCKKDSIVFTVGDEETHIAATVCRECVNDMGSDTVSDVIEKYGSKNDEVFKPGVVYHKKPTAG